MEVNQPAGQKGRDFVVLNMPVEVSEASCAIKAVRRTPFSPGTDGGADVDR